MTYDVVVVINTLLCLTSSEESKPCFQLSLPTVILLSSVSQVLLLKIKSFKSEQGY